MKLYSSEFDLSPSDLQNDAQMSVFRAAENVIKRLEEEIEFEKLREENEKLQKCLKESQK